MKQHIPFDIDLRLHTIEEKLQRIANLTAELRARLQSYYVSERKNQESFNSAGSSIESDELDVFEEECFNQEEAEANRGKKVTCHRALLGVKPGDQGQVVRVATLDHHFWFVVVKWRSSYVTFMSKTAYFKHLEETGAVAANASVSTYSVASEGTPHSPARGFPRNESRTLRKDPLT